MRVSRAFGLALVLIALPGAILGGSDDVPIGYFGPSDPSHPLGGDLWLAANLAVEEANRAGGYRGRSFRLVPAWSENPWGSGVAQVARMVYDKGVWAIVGSIDGASTHLAEQVVAKARLTLINPAGTDQSVSMARVPWAFSCLPDDDAQAIVLWRLLRERIADAPFVLVSSTDHDSHHAASAFADRVSQEGASPRYHLEFAPESSDLSEIADRVVASAASAVVVMAAPEAAARFVTSLRRRDAKLPLLGGHTLGRRPFIASAGEAAEGALFPLPCDAAFGSGPFAETFRKRTGHPPDCTTVQTYDATRILIESIVEAGLDRAAIREALAQRKSWNGAAGRIEWDSLGRNRRTIGAASVRDGVVVPRGLE